MFLSRLSITCFYFTPNMCLICKKTDQTAQTAMASRALTASPLSQSLLAPTPGVASAMAPKLTKPLANNAKLVAHGSHDPGVQEWPLLDIFWKPFDCTVLESARMGPRRRSAQLHPSTAACPCLPVSSDCGSQV